MDMPSSQSFPLVHDAAATAKDIEQNKDIAAFSYLWVMSVIVYFLKKDASPFIRFHSKQAMVLFGVSIIFAFVPYLNRVLEVIVLVGCVFGFMAATQGQWKDVPFVGPFSRGEMSLRQVWQEIVTSVVRLSHALKDLTKSSAKSPPKQEPAPTKNGPTQKSNSPTATPPLA